jgi:hypothetical protein
MFYNKGDIVVLVCVFLLSTNYIFNCVSPEKVSAESSHHSSENDDVEIKEEPAEVVEISSDEEKPKIEHLQAGNTKNSLSSSFWKEKKDSELELLLLSYFGG